MKRAHPLDLLLSPSPPASDSWATPSPRLAAGLHAGPAASWVNLSRGRAPGHPAQSTDQPGSPGMQAE